MKTVSSQNLIFFYHATVFFLKNGAFIHYHYHFFGQCCSQTLAC